MTKDHTLKISIFAAIVLALAASVRFFLGIHFVNIGFSGMEIGIIFAINSVTSIVSILPSGFGNDSKKSKNLISIALILEAILYFGLSTTMNFPVIALLFLIGGTGHTMLTVSTDSLFYKSTGKKKVTKKIGIYLAVTHITIGLGMLSAGIVRELTIPFEKIFFTISSVFILMALIGQIVLPGSITSEFKLLNYKKDIFRPKVLIFMLIIALFAIHFAAENTSYGLFLKENLLLTNLQMGLYMGIPIVIMGISALVIYSKFKNWKGGSLLLFALFVSGSGHILMTINNPLISFGFRIYHEIGDIAYFFFLFYGITQLFDLKRIGGNASIFALIATLSSTIASLIFGPLGTTYGHQWPLIISGITTLIAFIITIKFITLFDHKNA